MKVQRRFEKEKEINRRFCGGERQEKVEESLKSDDPTESDDDVGSLVDEGDEGVVMTLGEHRLRRRPRPPTLSP